MRREQPREWSAARDVIRDVLAATPAKAAAGLALHPPGSVILIAGGYDDLGGGPMHSAPRSASSSRARRRSALAPAPTPRSSGRPLRDSPRRCGAGLASIAVHKTLAEAAADARARAGPGLTIVFAPWFSTTPGRARGVPRHARALTLGAKWPCGVVRLALVIEFLHDLPQSRVCGGARRARSLGQREPASGAASAIGRRRRPCSSTATSTSARARCATSPTTPTRRRASCCSTRARRGSRCRTTPGTTRPAGCARTPTTRRARTRACTRSTSPRCARRCSTRTA